MPQRLLENVCTSALDQCLAKTHEDKFKCSSVYDRTQRRVFVQGWLSKLLWDGVRECVFVNVMYVGIHML
jgi:hypothetical protein